ncbi:MAG: LacI family DNA-binding transcriptional regulator [Pseudomonadota bacterium]
MRQSQPGQKVTIFDVAERAQVSIKTVSRVVNREPNVRDSTREKVEKAIRSLRYQPDQSARNLASQHSHLIGLVYDDPERYALPSAGFIIRMQQGALRACRAGLHELLIHPCDFSKRNIGSELRSLIRATRLSGIVLAPPLSNMPRVVRAIHSTNTPLVRLSPGRRLAQEWYVETNDREVSAQMIDHLVELGHRDIAFIKGNETHKAVGNRYLGYLDGLARYDIKVKNSWIRQGDNAFNSGEQAAKELLALSKRPSAIFAANDDMAAGAMRYVLRQGLRVPQDISVAGFDDVTLSRQLDPRLTTIRQPVARMTEHAVSLLAQSTTTEPQGHCVAASLAIRESTGPALHSR